MHNTLLKSDVTRCDHVSVVMDAGSCSQFHSQIHSRQHSLRITLKYTTLVRMRSSYAWTMKPWQRNNVWALTAYNRDVSKMVNCPQLKNVNLSEDWITSKCIFFTQAKLPVIPENCPACFEAPKVSPINVVQGLTVEPCYKELRYNKILL